MIIMMTNFVLVMTTVTISYVVTYTSAQYCNLESCNDRGTRKEHTLCAYTPQNKCKDGISSGLSGDEKKAIVELHNELRRKVASGQEIRGNPGPQRKLQNGKMANLKWDEEIAKIAQHWADQCQIKHDACRNTPKDYVGQNIGYKGTTMDIKNSVILIKELVKKWYDEVVNFDGRTSKFVSGKQNGKTVGHYTQIVWAETTRIGCGAVKYKTVYKNMGMNNLLLVCNYAPGGNIVGSLIY
ncbi:venom allergen 3-like [Copidosoma floridanum]|uniref:venom allergen 3-like n=1 Tax=Copidosoma floridanum TaxID=29053 RepID=UPI0006C95E7A|nr:venom allergen 3-like [Copidosoma floridanum]